MEWHILIKPYSYQQDIIDKTIEFKGNTLIQLPTGGGKTLISYNIALELHSRYNKQILFVAPKINLMEQTLEAFKNSKPQKIHKNTPFNKNHPILVSTIQTASRRDLNPDVIIIDEIHYGFDGKMIEGLVKDKPNVRIIGLSATPYDKNGRLLQGFDLVLNKYDMKYMIENGYLVPLKSYVLVKQNLSNVKLTAGDYNINQLSKVVSNNDTILEIVRTSKEFIENSKKTIVFAVDINHCELLTEAFKNEGFVTKSLHSNNDKDEFEIIEEFKKGRIKVLVSVLKLTTGFDVPDTDLAIIARPTKSQNLYKQMVGRVLRKAPNKKVAILLDCGNVIEELGEPLESIKENFSNIEKKNKATCSNCDNENIKLRKKENKYYWECLECEFIKELENKNLYKCAGCGKEHTYQSNFIQFNNKLFLKCDCNSLTLVSQHHGDEKFVEINSSINYKNSNVVDFDNIVQILVNKNNEIIKELNNINIDFKKLRLFSKESNEKNISFYNTLSNEEKIKLNNDLTTFLSICINIENNKDLDLFIKTLTFDIQNFIKYFKEWILIDKKIYEIDNKIAKKLEHTLNMKNLRALIRLDIVTLNSIIELTYKLKLYELIEKIIKEFDIKKFSYCMDNDTFVWEKSNFQHKFDEKYFSIVLPLIDTIDIGMCFDISDLMHGSENENEIIKSLYNIIHSIEIVDNFIKNFDNVKTLIFGKENKVSYLPYLDAKEYIKKTKIKKLEDWIEYKSKDDFPIEIPKEPYKIYKKEWEGWNKWLSSNKAIDNITYDIFDKKGLVIYNYLDADDTLKCFQYQIQKFLKYEKAKLFIHNLNLKSIKDWEEYKANSNFPANIPKSPDIYYTALAVIMNEFADKKEIKYWTNWNDWLGLSGDVKCSSKKIENKSIKNEKTNSAKQYKNNSVKDFLQNTKKDLLKKVEFALNSYSSDKLYLSQLKSNINDFFNKTENLISSDNSNDKNIEIRKKIENFEIYMEGKLKLYK